MSNIKNITTGINKSARTKYSFSRLPLSFATEKGLRQREYINMSYVQHECIPPLLAGYDIVGVAPTGSGKTLAFLVPILERLYRLNWQAMDGLGALIITPTRELAMQIFTVLNGIGLHHKLSAGVVCGGKSIEVEKKSLSAMNIIVATPGRLVQHLSESQSFCFDNLRMLVFDEVDTLFENGFYDELKTILEYLSKTIAMSKESYEKTLIEGLPNEEVKQLRNQANEIINSLQKKHFNINSLNPQNTIVHEVICKFKNKKLEENNTGIIKSLKNLKKTISENPFVYLARVENSIEESCQKEVKEKLKTASRYERQTMFFTATISTKTTKLIKKLIMDSAYYITDNNTKKEGPIEIRISQRDTENETKKNNDQNKEKEENKEENENEILPTTLANVIMEVHPADKLDIVFSFIRSHVEQKTIIFFSTTRQVSFIYEAFRRLQPGVPIMHLDGRMKQNARQEVYFSFVKSKAAVLLATDLVARGLDFPLVHWVIQADCPPDSRTFIHRAGRAARMDRIGGNLLLVTAQEKPGMLDCLKKAGIKNLQEKNLSLKRAVSIRQALTMLCIKNSMIMALAKKAVSAYAKSIHVQPNKTIFPLLKDLDLISIAESYGITGVNIHKVSVISNEEKTEKETEKQNKKEETRFEKAQKRQNVDIIENQKETNKLGISIKDENEDLSDFLKVVKVHKPSLDENEKAQLAKLISDKTYRKITSGTLEEAAEAMKEDSKLRGIKRHILFDEDEDEKENAKEKEETEIIDEEKEQEDFIEQRRKAISAEDETDRITYNKILKDMKRAAIQQNESENETSEDDYVYEDMEENNEEEYEEDPENSN